MANYIIGYGSLLSEHSRRTYSNLHVDTVPVIAEGWRRGWTTRYPDEGATYAGVRPHPGALLTAALVPAVVDDALRHRERGYVFTEVSAGTIHVLDHSHSALPDGRYWIVVNREQIVADIDHPIPQTYVDTCLIGCLETGGEAMARAFLQGTELWDGYWLDDRDHTTPLYPRLTRAGDAMRTQIDTLLEEAGLLKLRRHMP